MESPLHIAARRRHGVLLTREAVALGYDDDFFRRMVRAEGWHRLFRGAYLLPGYEAGPAAYVAAVQARRPDLVASHGTAAALWGMAGDTDGVEFTGPVESFTGLPRSQSQPRLRYARDRLGQDEVRLLVGLHVTTPARTAADLLLTRARDAAVITVDSAVCAGLTTLAEIAASLERRPHRDHRLAAAWTGFRLADGSAESPVETLTRLKLHDAGLTHRTQVPVRVGDRVRRVDFLVEGVVLETEGTRYHGGREEHERDVRRFNELVMMTGGRPFLRATYDDVVHHWPRTLALLRRTAAAWRAQTEAA